MIPVTKTFLPDEGTYNTYLKRIWRNGWLTNGGELKKELENSLCQYLKIDNIILTTNGTIPIQIALRNFCNEAEIITTPFSYIATSSSIVWQNCKPLYVDINEKYLTIDEQKIEESITPNTKAILATHIFGNACHIEAIEKIAKKYNLLVIYDAAHCFGVKYRGKPLFSFGDISTCSFHATKVFHTAEGGGLVCNREELSHQLKYSVNFGHKGHYDYYGMGINAKMSELHAAMGLSVLQNMNFIFAEYKRVIDQYSEQLNFERIRPLQLREGVVWNYSYFPIIFENEELLLKALSLLKANQIFPRRYFYPSLNTIDYLSGQRMPIAESISKRILCLPLYVGLEYSSIDTICDIINSVVMVSTANRSL